MDYDKNQDKYESVYSQKVRAGKRRTYFFDVRKTRGEDYYVTLTESKRRMNDDGYERHKIFIYKEDFNRFMTSLEDVINHVKTELMPDYDYDEFVKKHAEWEKQRAEQALEEANIVSTETAAEESTTTETSDDSEITENISSEEDMSW